jgi:hypothetical protein
MILPGHIGKPLRTILPGQNLVTHPCSLPEPLKIALLPALIVSFRGCATPPGKVHPQSSNSATSARPSAQQQTQFTFPEKSLLSPPPTRHGSKTKHRLATRCASRISKSRPELGRFPLHPQRLTTASNPLRHPQSAPPY